ncbi:MAG: P27 family phage terminase small subunit [Eubacteriales bacterium]
MKKVPTPKHLQPSTRKWFKSVLEDFELEPHHIKILTLAAETWDRCNQAREILKAEGLTYTDRFGCPRARPEVAVERDSRIAFARLVRELALDVEPPRAPGRPPGLY